MTQITRASQVRKELIDLGQSTKAIYDSSKDLNAAKHAIRAFTEANKTAVAQVHYKRLTALPFKIPYLEEDDS